MPGSKKPKPEADKPMFRIKLVRSTVGHNPRNRATVEALGLRKLNQVRELPDTPSIRGMVMKVKELLEVDVPGTDEKFSDARANPRKGINVGKGVTPPNAHRAH